MEMKTMTGKTDMDRVSTVVTAIQGMMLAAYGASAILLHQNMATYDLNSVSESGSPVHAFYLLTILTGLCLIIYRVVYDRRKPGFVQSPELLTPVIVTLVAWLFSQANTVYTSTSGGTLGGFLGYGLRALLTGSDPVDSFVYGNGTVLKYFIVTLFGLAAAAFTILRMRRTSTANEMR